LPFASFDRRLIVARIVCAASREKTGNPAADRGEEFRTLAALVAEIHPRQIGQPPTGVSPAPGAGSRSTPRLKKQTSVSKFHCSGVIAIVTTPTAGWFQAFFGSV
jgi:hypothetical protein